MNFPKLLKSNLNFQLVILGEVIHTDKMHPVETVPTDKIHPVGTAPMDKMHPLGTVLMENGIP